MSTVRNTVSMGFEVCTYNRTSIDVFRVALTVLHFQANPGMII